MPKSLFENRHAAVPVSGRPSGRRQNRARRGRAANVAVLAMALVAALLGWTARAAAFDQTHAAWGEVLKSYVGDGGRVRYAQLKADTAKQKDHPLTRYIAAIQAVKAAEFRAWTPAEQKALLINAYNALTLHLVVDHYPVASIKDIGGFFTRPWNIEFFNLLDGMATTLDKIEHQILRPDYKDCRIHAAVNCASVSCPQLRAEPYVGAKLDAQLDDQMRVWLADPHRNQFDPGAGVAHLSKIFDWYEQDFAGWGGGVRSVVARFGPRSASFVQTKPGSKLDYLDYDWQLNDASAAPAAP